LRGRGLHNPVSSFTHVGTSTSSFRMNTGEGSLRRRDFCGLPRPSFGAQGLSPIGESLPHLSFLSPMQSGGGFDSARAAPFGIALPQPLLPCGGKVRVALFPDSIWRIASSASEVTLEAWMVCPDRSGVLPSSSVWSGLPGGGGIPPGRCPRRFF